MNCPACGGDCTPPSEKVLNEIYEMYAACSSCPSDPELNKSAPFYEKLDSNNGRCKKCGKRHLDLVIGNVLTILKESGYFPSDAALKEVGTPLIAFGYNIPYPPRLGKRSLILIMDLITKQLADRIFADVPEIKGVIKRTGLPSKSIGILDIDQNPHTYELLSGCDRRCDVIFSTFGELCIYRTQSRVHIEFNTTKIPKIEQLYLKGELDNAVVVDGFCGPGTLGLLCALGSARRIILNDAWLPALIDAILNIKINSHLLAVEIVHEVTDYHKQVGDEPVLLARAMGRSEILVYHSDIRKLGKVVRECDICLIDTFPKVDPAEYKALCREFAKKVVII
jgi:hypothetical protein